MDSDNGSLLRLNLKSDGY
uniref:Uncharacterized protein n=1 Tax=Arundo donax TaxID=35708 RepID=A0A0A9EY25_ARUDO